MLAQAQPLFRFVAVRRGLFDLCALSFFGNLPPLGLSKLLLSGKMAPRGAVLVASCWMCVLLMNCCWFGVGGNEGEGLAPSGFDVFRLSVPKGSRPRDRAWGNTTQNHYPEQPTLLG